ncbi:MAG: hypothetical protein AAF420_15145 [Pseudomonadota bacterium]
MTAKDSGEEPDRWQLLCDLLTDEHTGAGIGCLGAIGEFAAVPGEENQVSIDDCSLSVSNSRGALKVSRECDFELLAFENLSQHPERWTVGLSCVAPVGRELAGGVKPLGKDAQAIVESERDAQLYDLGVPVSNMRFCVRTATPQLITALDAAAGTSILDASHALWRALLQASPTRVVISELARIEIYQPIVEDETPFGPHTHLLPDLIAARRTHSANVPIPDDHSPLLEIYPRAPWRTAANGEVQFDVDAAANFDKILRRFGVPDYVDTKTRVINALLAERSLDEIEIAPKRVARLARKIAQRQILQTARTQH